MTGGLLRGLCAAIVIVLFAAVGCGDDDDDADGSATTAETTTETGTDAAAEPVVDDRFAVGKEDAEVAIRCWGEGSPTIVFEAGHPASGLDDYDAEPGFQQLVADLSQEKQVCVYARAGTPQSAPLPKRRRTVDDLVENVHELLPAADVEAPYLLVGSSFGGLVVMHYAGRYRDDVAGIVLLDVPSAAPDLTPKIAPEAAWDHPANTEHVDAIATERLLATDPLPIAPIPVRVVTASSGDSDEGDQGYWLEFSPNASQVTIEGSHDLHFDNPDAVAREIGRTLGAAD